ncbi:MAG: type III-A CRISPR-associated protein Cas10/Csm1 [bacterium]
MTVQSSLLQPLIIGTFLHDIGKVMQRAGVPVSHETENLMNKSGPTRDGHSSHYHVQWTSQFFDELFPKGILPPVSVHEERVSELAFRHHNPSTPLQWIVTRADCLSSGMDRGESKYEKGISTRKRMVPLRSLLRHEGKPEEPYPRLPLKELTSQDDSSYLDDEDLTARYQSLWREFLKNWEEPSFSTFDAILARIDSLYEKFFWSVPASTIDILPDTSLYEHSKTAAAIAGALYLYHQETGTLNESAVKDDEIEKFLFVSGDLSGIQNYIFNIAHQHGKVAKRLRARSFILSLIASLVARQILDKVGLPFINTVLSAGGKFYLLLPNLERVRVALAEQEQVTQQWLQEKFQGILNLNLAYVTMKGSDFLEKRISEKFAEVVNALQIKKYHPQQTLLNESSGWNEEAFLLPNATIQEQSPTGQYDLQGLGDDEEIIGRKLPRTKCMAVYADEESGDHELLGWSFSLAESTAKLRGNPLYLISFDKQKEYSFYRDDVPVHYEYRAMHVPTYQPGDYPEIDDAIQADTEEHYDKDQILPFHLIALASQGRRAIAYLKADLDNLGLLLRKGLDWHTSGWTLSKMATFSRSLEFFFSGRINNILRCSYPMIYTVFSGGDDLLLVGPWNHLHDFARQLRQEWKAYTFGNPQLTLSVGVSLTRPMTPVGFAADSAENALHSAKSGGRNRLSSFGHVMQWQEVDQVFDDVDQLHQWLQEGRISVSFVRNLLYFSQLWEQYKKHNQIEGLRYLPLLSYMLSRNVKNGDEDIRQWAERYKEADGEAIRHLRFVATYALNLNRGS